MEHTVDRLLWTLIIPVWITWRLTALVHRESGPWRVFARLRERIGVTYDQYSNCEAHNQTAAMLCCFRCTSIWIGWGIAIGVNLLIPSWPRFAWIPLGIAYSAAAIGYDKWTNPKG